MRGYRVNVKSELGQESEISKYSEPLYKQIYDLMKSRLNHPGIGLVLRLPRWFVRFTSGPIYLLARVSRHCPQMTFEIN